MDFRTTRLAVAAMAAAVFAGASEGQPVPSTVATTTQSPAAVTRLEVAPGTKALFRVREQLAGISFPNDAVGSTENVKGSLMIRPDGTIDATNSRFTVDLRTLSTDQDRRDNYLRRNTLQTDQFPEAVFVARRAVGLTWPPPTAPAQPPGQPSGQGGGGQQPAGQAGAGQSGAGQGGGGQAAAGQGRGGQSGSQPTGPRPGFPVGFQLVGDMTIHGVTKEITWNVYTSFIGDAVRGKAMTSFPFAMFNLERPSVAVVMSVEDDIRLELELNLKRTTS